MTNHETPACRTTQHCAFHGWCRRCDPAFAAVMSRVNVAIQRTDADDTHWGPLYAAVAEALRPAAVSVPPPATRADDRAAVLREAAAAIEAEQAREEATEWAQYGELDHETEVQGGAVRHSAGLLRRLAAEAQRAKPDRCPHGCDISTCPCLACEADEEQQPEGPCVAGEEQPT